MAKAKLIKSSAPEALELFKKCDAPIKCKLVPTQKRYWYIAGLYNDMFVVYSNKRKPEDTMLVNQAWVWWEED